MLAVLNGRLFGAGARVAGVYHRLLGLVFLGAWISLGVQVRVLMGAHGLLPAAPYLDELNRAGVSIWQAPSWLRATDCSDGVLIAGIVVGALAALSCVVGRPRRAVRALFALQAVLYLGYCLAGRTFFQFQWDELFVESAVLASLLPADRAERVPQLLCRLLLFKLYFESGIAKWQSHLGDWQAGSAMTHYYETAPLPNALGYWAHFLPVWWHHFESRATLVLELVVPFSFFAPWRAVRLVAFVLVGGFQIINFATANYGFFIPLAIALHVFLLDDELIERAAVRLHLQLRPVAEPRRRLTPAMVFAPVWLLFSVDRALADFAGVNWLPPGAQPELYVFNTYHLFGHITVQRIEPELQTFDGTTWTAQHLHHQPGDTKRAPSQVAPHQPRVDFQMWFYGLAYQRGAPQWVQTLARRLCDEPATVQQLFEHPLPAAPMAVRLVFWRVSFVTPDERRHTNVVWSRAYLDETHALSCRKEVLPSP